MKKRTLVFVNGSDDHENILKSMVKETKQDSEFYFVIRTKDGDFDIVMVTTAVSCDSHALPTRKELVDFVRNGLLKKDLSQFIATIILFNDASIMAILQRLFPIVLTEWPEGRNNGDLDFYHCCLLGLFQHPKLDLNFNHCKDHHHPGIRGLLFWLKESKFDYEPIEFGVANAELPSFLLSPLSLTMEMVDELSTLSQGLIKIKNTKSSELCEIFAIVKKREREGEKSINISFIEPAFTDLFISYFTKKTVQSTPLVPSAPLLLPIKRTQCGLLSGEQASVGQVVSSFSPRVSLSLPFTDPSISLSHWIPSQNYSPQTPIIASNTSSPPTNRHTNSEAIKSQNKNILKKLMLLSLRNVGIDKHHEEFQSIWKHLYCGCLFAFRKELATIKIPQGEMLTVIRSNMNFLNIK